MKLLGTVLAGLALSAAAPAFAGNDMQPAKRADVDALAEFSSCVVEHARGDAERLVQADYRNERYHDDLRRLAQAHPSCLGPFGALLRMSPVLLAGGIAEALLREDTNEAELTTSLRPPEPAIEARSDGEAVAMCMALRLPSDTSALVFSDPSGADSDARLVSYANALPQCVQQGQELRINKPGLRALAALAAYRIARTNRSGGEG